MCMRIDSLYVHNCTDILDAQPHPLFTPPPQYRVH